MKIGNLDISSFKVGGDDCIIYLGDVKLYPTEQPIPTFNGKFLLKYSDGTSYSAECDSTSAVTSTETSGSTSDFSAVTEVIVGDCVRTIGSEAFSSNYYDNSISAITIGSGVTSIGNLAFFYAGYNSTSQPFALDIPSSVNIIGSSAFYESNISSVTFNSDCSIDESAFQYCNNLRTVNNCPIHGLARNEYQFADCTSLTDVTFDQTNGGSTSISIGNGAFLNCTSLSSVTLPHADGMSSSVIQQSVFYGCSSLKSINIPQGYGTVEGNAFKNCTSLSSVTLSDTVYNIGAQGNTFENCSSLSSITIPSGVTYLGASVFNGCSSLTSVTFENNGSVNMDVSYAFDNTIARTYNMALYVSNGNININPSSSTFGSTPNLHTINVTNYNSLTLEDWVTIYGNYTWRYIIDTLNYLTCPYQFTLEQSSTYTETMCHNGNLYGYYPTEIKYNGTSYGYAYDEDGQIILTEVLLEEGAAQCQPQTSVVFNAPQLWSEIGNATSNTFSNGGVTITSQNNTGLRLTGSTSSVAQCRVSGKTNTATIEITTDNDIEIENVTMVANSSGDMGRLSAISYTFRENYDQTSGTCSINGTTRYWNRYKLKEGYTKQTSIPFGQSGGGTVTFIYIAINVDDDWTDNLPPP